ncbi:Receptor protein kinase [Spatholobus suberectus]|nr:Receptor protein kinase [Spatholobus suberectus]
MDDHKHVHMHNPMLVTSLLTMMCLLLLTTTLPQFHCEPSAFDYSVCKEQSYKCGNLWDISYPFWGQNRSPQCGGGDTFQLTCHDDNTTSIQIGSQNFRVKVIDMNAQTMRVVRADLALRVCFPQFEDTDVNPILFRYPTSDYYNMTIFYDCPSIPQFPPGYNFTCGHALSYFIGDFEGMLNEFPLLQSCKRRLHVRADALEYDAAGGDRALTQILHKGFEINYNVSQDCIRCLGSEGDCWSNGINIDEHVLSCYYCPDGSHALHCSHKSVRKLPRKIILGQARMTLIKSVIADGQVENVAPSLS